MFDGIAFGPRQEIHSLGHRLASSGIHAEPLLTRAPRKPQPSLSERREVENDSKLAALQKSQQHRKRGTPPPSQPARNRTY